MSSIDNVPMDEHTARFFLDPERAMALGRMGGIVSLTDDNGAGEMWKRMAQVAEHTPQAWQAFVKGWNDAVQAFTHGVTLPDFDEALRSLRARA